MRCCEWQVIANTEPFSANIISTTITLQLLMQLTQFQWEKDISNVLHDDAKLK